jgi:hypothetical protein
MGVLQASGHRVVELGSQVKIWAGHPSRANMSDRPAANAAPAQKEWRPKIMGAGIAAGPHCPVALDPAETGSPALGGFEGRRPGRKPRKAKPRSRFLRGPSTAKAASGFPAGSPSGPKPWRFAVGGFEAEASLPTLAGTAGRSLWFRVRRDPEPKPWFRLASPWAKALGHCRVRSSRAEARSCPTLSKPKLLSGRWQRADRGPAFRRAGPEPEGPVSRLSGSAGPKTLGSDGRFTKPAAFALAKGQARSFRLAAASSAALPSAPIGHPPEGDLPISAWAVAGKAIPRCRRIVSATSGSWQEKRVIPSRFDLWIKRITCITSPPPNFGRTAARGQRPRPHAWLAPGAPPA